MIPKVIKLYRFGETLQEKNYALVDMWESFAYYYQNNRQLI